jgi:hypothetical protein
MNFIILKNITFFRTIFFLFLLNQIKLKKLIKKKLLKGLSN